MTEKLEATWKGPLGESWANIWVLQEKKGGAGIEGLVSSPESFETAWYYEGIQQLRPCRNLQLCWSNSWREAFRGLQDWRGRSKHTAAQTRNAWSLAVSCSNQRCLDSNRPNGRCEIQAGQGNYAPIICRRILPSEVVKKWLLNLFTTKPMPKRPLWGSKTDIYYPRVRQTALWRLVWRTNCS